MRDKSWGIMQACLGMSIKPAETLYIGDTIYDIKAAKGANAHSAGIASGSCKGELNRRIRIF